MRSRLIIIVALLACMLACWMILASGKRRVTARSASAVDAIRSEPHPFNLPKYSPSPSWSQYFNDVMAHMQNDLIRRDEPWSDQDVSLLVELIGAPVKHAGDWDSPDVQRDEVESFVLMCSAAAFASGRMLRGGAIEPEAKRTLHAALFRLLDSRSSDVRNCGVSTCFESGLVEDSSVRSRLEAQVRHDPEVSVRVNIQNRFRDYEYLRRNAHWARGVQGK